MAETVLLDGSNYEFEIFIVNPLEGGEYQVVPIAKSNIKYLEVTNDLVHIGYVGKVVFTNFYSVLQKLNLFTSLHEAPYMYLYFKNLDFNATDAGSTEVFLTASLQKGQEINTNSIEGNLYYEFEELSIARLKRTKIIYLKNNLDYLKDESAHPVNAIKRFFENGISESAIMDGTISTALTEIKGEIDLTGVFTDITQITNLNNQDTYYSMIEKLYAYASFISKVKGLDGWYSPALVQLENDTKKKKRKLVISSILDSIHDFFDKIKSSPTDKEMKNYLLERFNLSQSGDVPYFSDNYLDKYELKRVNYEDVFSNKWTTIELVCETVECNDQYQINYSDLRAAFENMTTNPFASNLPDRRGDTIQGEVKEVQYSRPGIDITLAQIYGTNKVFKSFIFDNLAITFRTKGQPYRVPGKFITIKTDNVDVNAKDKNLSEVNGHWYVVSVKHIFENDVYFNDFVCVKLYNPSGKLSSTPLSPINRRTGSASGSTEFNSDTRRVSGQGGELPPTISDLDNLPLPGAAFSNVADFSYGLETKQINEKTAAPINLNYNKKETFIQAFEKYNIPSPEEVEESLNQGSLLPPLPP